MGVIGGPFKQQEIVLIRTRSGLLWRCGFGGWRRFSRPELPSGVLYEDHVRPRGSLGPSITSQRRRPPTMKSKLLTSKEIFSQGLRLGWRRRGQGPAEITLGPQSSEDRAIAAYTALIPWRSRVWAIRSGCRPAGLAPGPVPSGSRPRKGAKKDHVSDFRKSGPPELGRELKRTGPDRCGSCGQIEVGDDMSEPAVRPVLPSLLHAHGIRAIAPA